MKTAVSVIIPIYNTEKTLLVKAIESVLQQTFSDFECILVNDCSTDNCAGIVESYAKKDNRIKVIHNIQNMGCPKSREVGFLHSTGDYILFADSDDFMEKDMIAELYKLAVENQLDIAYCDYYEHCPASGAYKRQGEYSDKRQFIKAILGRTVWASLWTKLIARDLCQTITFPSLFTYEDEIIVIQALSSSRKIGYLEKALYHYVYHEIDRFGRAKYMEEYYIHTNLITDFLRKNYPSQMHFFNMELQRRVDFYIHELIITNAWKNRKKLFELFPLPVWYLHKALFRRIKKHVHWPKVNPVDK
ncbi:hypothetical protein FACS1894182_06610 [Bacteroidia bacterium]|nr:hypothetical protein FACS1894182_06610 [Bacteroidia bacterium]